MVKNIKQVQPVFPVCFKTRNTEPWMRGSITATLMISYLRDQEAEEGQKFAVTVV